MLESRRHLEHQPIRARRDAWSYRLGRFLRRHAFAVAASGAVALALVVGLVGSVWQARIAEHERQRAELERRRAEQRFEDVRGLAHAMIFELHDELVKLPGSTAARSLLVQQALTYLQRLGKENDAAIPLRRELAEAWLRVGDVQGAPGQPNLGDLQGALKSYAQAADRVDSVLREAPGDRAARVLQAQVLLHRADTLFMTSALAEADAGYRRDIALWSRLRDDRVTDAGRGLARAQNGLARVLFWGNRREEALAQYTRAQATMEAAGPGDGPTEFELFLGEVEVNRGDTLNWLGRHEEAATLLLHARDRLQALHQAQPDDPTIVFALAKASMRLGDNMINLPDKRPMLAAYEAAHATLAKQAAVDPADMRAKRDLALCDQEIGDALVDLKRYDEAMAHYRAALQAEQDVSAREPHDETTQQDMANTWYGIGALYQARGQNGEAVSAYRQSLALRQALVARDPAAALRRDVAMVLGDLADALPAGAEACSDWIADDALWKQLSADSGEAPTDHERIAIVHQRAQACR